jgi:hypothetical protein
LSWKLAHSPNNAGRAPWRILDEHGQEVAWLYDFLDAQCLRGLAPLTLRTYGLQLLHFGRWFATLRRPWQHPEPALLADYLRFQLGQPAPPSTPTINGRLQLVAKLCRFHFGQDLPTRDLQIGRAYWRRSPLGYGRCPGEAIARAAATG